MFRGTTRPAVVDAVRDADPDAPFVLYQTGGFGIEPITYVLSETGADAARLAAELVADAADK